MENIRVLSENFQFLEVKFSIYLYRPVFQMMRKRYCSTGACAKWEQFGQSENILN